MLPVRRPALERDGVVPTIRSVDVLPPSGVGPSVRVARLRSAVRSASALSVQNAKAGLGREARPRSEVPSASAANVRSVAAVPTQPVRRARPAASSANVPSARNEEAVPTLPEASPRSVPVVRTAPGVKARSADPSASVANVPSEAAVPTAPEARPRSGVPSAHAKTVPLVVVPLVEEANARNDPTAPAASVPTAGVGDLLEPSARMAPEKARAGELLIGLALATGLVAPKVARGAQVGDMRQVETDVGLAASAHRSADAI
jgi:hypothetical protein